MAIGMLKSSIESQMHNLFEIYLKYLTLAFEN